MPALNPSSSPQIRQQAPGIAAGKVYWWGEGCVPACVRFMPISHYETPGGEGQITPELPTEGLLAPPSAACSTGLRPAAGLASPAFLAWERWKNLGEALSRKALKLRPSPRSKTSSRDFPSSLCWLSPQPNKERRSFQTAAAPRRVGYRRRGRGGLASGAQPGWPRLQGGWLVPTPVRRDGGPDAWCVCFRVLTGRGGGLG